MERIEVQPYIFLVAISFGDHTLHHLFPTIDHSKLPLIHDIFHQTLKEFNVRFNVNSIGGMAFGMIRQIGRTKVHSDRRKQFKTIKEEKSE
jgi:fatty acid desaturase